MKRIGLILAVILSNVAVAQTLSAGPDATICAPDCVDLTATFTGGGSTTGYSESTIAFSPDPYAGTAVSLWDDSQTGLLPIGFEFCFYGNNYTQFVICSNNWIGFSTGMTSTWVTSTVPSTAASRPKNCIMGPWQDINPGIGGSIRYQTLGAAPFRRLVVTYQNVPMYSCTSLQFTAQIIIYEGTNIIENHISSKPICPTWNSGNAVQSLHNLPGTVADIMPGRNNTNWTASNEGKRWTPNGAPLIEWWEGATLLGTGATVTVCPATTTTYTAKMVTCGGGVILSDDVTVFVDSPPTPANAGPDQTICGTTTTMAATPVTVGTGTWTVTSGGSTVTSPSSPTSGVTGLTPGVHTYTWTTSNGICPPTVDAVTITVATPVTAGPDNTISTCNSAAPLNLNASLTGADPGTWVETTVPASGGFTPATGMFNPAGLAAGAYTFEYTATGTAPCPDDIAVITVNVAENPTAGLDNSTDICNTPGSSVNLNTLLSGADAGGAWAETTFSGAFNPATGILNTAGLAAGTYNFTYTVTGVAPCTDDVANFSVTVQQVVNAGSDNSTSICNVAGSMVDVNALLSGADVGGTWTETTVPASGTFNPLTAVLNTAGLAGGTYTFQYFLDGVAPCPDDMATISVVVQDEVNAGFDNTTDICNTAGSTVNMNTLLSGADAGGTWAETTFSGSFAPATGVLTTGGLAAGVYNFTYTLTGIAPCPTDVANFSVTVQQEAIAGADNSAILCNSVGSALSLSTLLSGAAAGGTWAETTIPVSGGFNPLTTVFNAAGLAAGSYTFTYTVAGVAPCIDDVANFTVIVTDLPNAGADNSTQICNVAGSTVNMNTLLSGADAGGTWAETTVPASGTFNPITGVLNTAGLGAGVYTFAYNLAAVGPCPGDQALFTVTVQQEVDAGADNSTDICNIAGSTVNMNTLLSGADAGGAWAETTVPTSGAFTPMTGVLNTAGLAAGTYTFSYTMTGVAPCPNDVSNFSVTVQQEVTAGTDNTTQICNTAGSTVDLNALLTGADPGGSWVETSASGAFSPATGILTTGGLAASTYNFTYTVAGVAPCPDDVANFSVTVEQEVTAGLDNTTQVCNTAGSTVNLNTLLSGADPAGAWVAVTGTGGAFNPATGVLTAGGLTAGTYTFTYTVTGVPPCPNDVASFTVDVEQEAIAGADNTAQLCNSVGSTLNLNTLLSGAAAGGTWFETTASGAFNAVTGVFNAAGLAAGVYSFTYTVAGVAPCPDDVANFTVTVSDLPDAGLDNSTSICNVSGSSVDVNTLLSGADAGGIWADITASGSFNPATGVLNTSGLGAGTYTITYTLPAVGVCPSDMSSFDITVQQEVDAGSDNSTSKCNTAGSTVNLNTLLTGADAGGAWTETTASGAFTPATGILNTDGLAAGTYTFQYYVTAVAPCPDDMSSFTVTVEQEVYAGEDNSTQVCNYVPSSVDLNTLLSGADLGGSWMELTSSGAFSSGSGILNTSSLAAGDYEFRYTMDGVSPCPDDIAEFVVTVNAVPTLDVLDDEDLCDAASHTAQTFTSDVPGTTYDWTVGAGSDIGFGTSGSGNIGSFVGSSGMTTDKTATITVIPTSPEGCEGNPVTFDITVHPLPEVIFNGTQLTGCAPHTVYFNNLSSGSYSCVWDFGNGTTAAGCGAVSNHYTYPGDYDITLTVTSDWGCVSTDTYTDYVSIATKPFASFAKDPTGVVTIDDTEVSFTNTSTGADGYTWDFGDGSPSTSEENPTHIFPTEGGQRYEVMLIAESDHGCPDTAFTQVIVDDVILFYIPNTFTPNQDERNPTFKPVMTAGIDIYDFHFMIFNRWGEIIFESFNPAGGWDGTYGDRGVIEDGTYVWTLDFGDTQSDKKHKHHGHVTILK